MYTLQAHRLLFLAQPRTASMAIGELLTEQLGGRRVGRHHSVPTEHPEVEIKSDWIVFSTVRNHWDAILSWHYKAVRGPRKSLDFYLTREVRRLRHHFKALPNGQFELYHRYLPLSTHVLRYETLQYDLNAVLALRGLGPVTIPLANNSVDRPQVPYQEVFDAEPELRDRVGAMFADEIERLGYRYR